MIFASLTRQPCFCIHYHRKGQWKKQRFLYKHLIACKLIVYIMIALCCGSMIWRTAILNVDRFIQTKNAYDIIVINFPIALGPPVRD